MDFEEICGKFINHEVISNDLSAKWKIGKITACKYNPNLPLKWRLEFEITIEDGTKLQLNSAQLEKWNGRVSFRRYEFNNDDLQEASNACDTAAALMAEEQRKAEEQRQKELQKGQEKAEQLKREAEKAQREARKELALAKIKEEEQKKEARNKLLTMIRGFDSSSVRPTVHFLYEYYSDKYFSRYIPKPIIDHTYEVRRYKSGNEPEYSNITQMLEGVIYKLACSKERKNVVLTVAPSSSPDKYPTTRKSIDSIVSNYTQNLDSKNKLAEIHYHNFGNLLRRTIGIIPAHERPEVMDRPSVEEHLNSMGVTENCILPEDSLVIVIDDIITKGNQMKACFILLHQLGVTYQDMAGICVGRTASYMT